MFNSIFSFIIFLKTFAGLKTLITFAPALEAKFIVNDEKGDRRRREISGNREILESQAENKISNFFQKSFGRIKKLITFAAP